MKHDKINNTITQYRLYSKKKLYYFVHEIDFVCKYLQTYFYFYSKDSLNKKLKTIQNTIVKPNMERKLIKYNFLKILNMSESSLS